MFIVIKKVYLIIAGSVLLSLFLGFFLISFATDSEKKATVIIDAGHGEPDGGCVGSDGTKEAGLNLSVSKKLEDLLKNDYNTIMTRSDENGIHSAGAKTITEKKRSDMQKRKSIKESSGADIFVSIHMNQFEQSKYFGAQVIYDKSNENAKRLAQEIQKQLSLIDENNKRQAMACNGSVFLLKSSQVASVIVECGFLSNSPELEKLKTDEYQNQLAQAIKQGIDAYFSSVKNPDTSS